MSAGDWIVSVLIVFGLAVLFFLVISEKFENDRINKENDFDRERYFNKNHDV